MDTVKRKAEEAATAGRQRIRDAEDSAQRWQEACEAKEKELREIQSDFGDAREAAKAASRANEELEEQRRNAEVKAREAREEAEDAFRRLNAGEEKAKAHTMQIAQELEEIRRAATEAADEGGRKLREEDDRAREWQPAVENRDRDLQDMRSRLDEAQRAQRAAYDAVRDLDEVKRQATEAAEKGGARIRDLESRAENLSFEMSRRDDELNSMREALEEALRTASTASDLEERLRRGEEMAGILLEDMERQRDEADAAIDG